MGEDLQELRTRAFYDWELRGRGWQNYGHAVPLEPFFVPFRRSYAWWQVDDGRKPSSWSKLRDRLFKKGTPKRHRETDDDEPTIRRAFPSPVSEWELLIPIEERITLEAIEGWLRASMSGMISFEVLGTRRGVSLRLAIPTSQTAKVLAQLEAFFPKVDVRKADEPLRELWEACPHQTLAAVEFGLAREFMLPLRMAEGPVDPLTAFVGSLASLEQGEVALFQILFEAVENPWDTHAVAAVTTASGEPFFADAPDLTVRAFEKCSTPLYAVAFRLAFRCEDENRAARLIETMASALAQYADPLGNEFTPLSAESVELVVEDVLHRSTHRSGMILSLPELASFVRLPSDRLRSQALIRIGEPNEALPEEVRGPTGVVLGVARYEGHLVPVRLSQEARMQHVHVIGASGTGKSTLLEHMIVDDITAGAGVAVLDPHGDLVDDILGRIPEDRIEDVVLIDPSDTKATAGWNILEAHSSVEKELLASDFVAVVRRLSTSWGDQMTVVLRNAVAAFLEADCGATLTELRKFLLDEAFRMAFLKGVPDEHIVSFWKEEYPLLTAKRPQAPILMRLDTFLGSRLVREVVTRTENGLDFRSLIDRGHIILAKLSQGAIGEENAALLGSLLVSKIHQVCHSRQDVKLEFRKPYFLYVDEFQQVVTPSMASLFSGLRKYRLGVTMAHHDLYQLHAHAPEVEHSVLSNAYTRVMFRVSDADARQLLPGEGRQSADDLTRLRRGETLCRVEQRDQIFRMKTLPFEPLGQEVADATTRCVRDASMARYGRRVPTAPDEPVAIRPMEPRRAQKEPTDVPVRPRSVQSSPVPPSPGRGGGVHKYLQGVVKAWGQSAGFRVEVEHELPTKERVDVALFRDDISLACEVAGTTTVDQETSNIRKCLEARFSHVIVVSLDAKFLRVLSETIVDTFPEDVRSHISLCAPEELLGILGTYAQTSSESRVAGYKVNVRQPAADDNTADERRQSIANVMLKSLKRLRENKE